MLLRKATVAPMDQPAGYLHWGFILISWPNLILIGLMVVLFALALILPFPGHRPFAKKDKKGGRARCATSRREAGRLPPAASSSAAFLGKTSFQTGNPSTSAPGSMSSAW